MPTPLRLRRASLRRNDIQRSRPRMAPMPMPRTSRLPPQSMPTATFSDRDAAASFVHLDVDLGAQAADLAFGEYPGIPIAFTDRPPSAWRARTHACFPTAARAFSAIGRGELQERKYRAPPQLQNAQLDHVGSGLPVTITVAVAPTDPLGTVLTVLGAPVRVWGTGRRPCCSRTSTRAISPGPSSRGTSG
jgi:hypothetical protein